MAASEIFITDASISHKTLLEKLALVLPKDIKFKIYHLSTPPTRTPSLYSAPPNCRPDRTYCESHFLSVSIDASAKPSAQWTDVLVFAIEILIYSTAFDTTFFVSKADSTGYLHLLELPKGTGSPLKDFSATFLQHLIEQHQRPNIRSIISLFARAQDQYLFPGSVEYSGKHVLDDRGLVKWWCRVLDPLISDSKPSLQSEKSQWDSIQGYLVVPGLDTHETLSYVPRTVGSISSSWTMGHPLRKISRHSDDVPPRCLIPHYPDDPKARFLDELDEELTKAKDSSSGQWKSVRSIDQFWDMMAYRQECSAGRLVGFIWVVFEPVHSQPIETITGDSQSTNATLDSQTWESEICSKPDNNIGSITPNTSFHASSQVQPTTSPVKLENETIPAHQKTTSSKLKTPPQKRKLSGPITPRQPRIKTEHKTNSSSKPETTPYYVWHPEGRGQVTVGESDYKRITELLLRLDFANIKLAKSSSTRWISEVRSGGGNQSEAWGQIVIGTRAIKGETESTAVGATSLNMVLVRKKRKAGTENVPVVAKSEEEPNVNVLSAGMVRKKAKV